MLFFISIDKGSKGRMRSVNITLLFKLMMILIVFFTYISINYEYHEKEKLTGYVSYKEQSEIYSPSHGYITDIHVKNHGKAVKGDTLLEIENTSKIQSTNSDLNTNELVRSSIQSKINLVKTKLNLTLDKISNSQEELKLHLVSTKKIIDDYEDSLFVLMDVYNQEKSRLHSDISLLERGLISEIDVEAKKIQVSNLHSEIVANRSKIKELLISKVNVDRQLQDLKLEYSIKVEEAKSETQKHESDLELHNQNNIYKINAIDSGIVEFNNLKIGQFIKEGQLLAKVVSNVNKVIYLNVLKENSALLSVGDDILIEIEALPFSEYGFFNGKISEIFDVYSPESEHTRVIEVSIISNFSDNVNINALKNGMSAIAYVNKKPTTLLEFFFLPVIKNISIDSGISNI